jgi:hypothetical protein
VGAEHVQVGFPAGHLGASQDLVHPRGAETDSVGDLANVEGPSRCAETTAQALSSLAASGLNGALRSLASRGYVGFVAGLPAVPPGSQFGSGGHRPHHGL